MKFESDELAAANIKAQEELLDAFYTVYQHGDKTMTQIATELGIKESDAQRLLTGSVDLTMTEIRYLANTLGCKITYSVDFPGRTG